MSKRKLLLADDSVTIQKVVNLTFADEGIEVISVGDGDSAMEKVAEISPDLIMADVNMPGLTGYEICERIRQDEKLRLTPVILLVGSFEPFDEEEARRVGANDYLTKPFQSIRQLVNKVTVLLESQNGEKSEAGSLEDTLEIDAEEIGAPQPEQNAEPTEPVQYADTSFDDEMIQTNRPSSFPFDETQKFAARETGRLEEVSQSESEGAGSAESSENLSENVEESISYKNTDDESDFLETESSRYIYELETNDGVSYEMNDFSKEFEKPADVSDNLEGSVAARIEDAETVSGEENVSSQSEDNAQTEAEMPEEIAAETKVEEDILEEAEEFKTSDETISDREDESVLAENSQDVLEETKDYAFISDQANEVSHKAETENEVSDELELEDAAEESEEMVAAEPENDNTEITQKTAEEEIPLPEYASVLEFDDDDILQLPPIELEIEEEVETEEIVAAPIVTTRTEPTAFVSTPKSVAIDSSNISAELIDTIVAKVLERLSDKAVKEVAWEVVPQMTELIVTKMAEEKFK